MGIDYSAVIVVGLWSEYLPKDFDEVENIECIQPYYDAPTEHSLWGIVIENSEDYNATEINLDVLELPIKVAKENFKRITGLDAKIYLSTRGW
jgi:hypothetical protein